MSVRSWLSIEIKSSVSEISLLNIFITSHCYLTSTSFSLLSSSCWVLVPSLISSSMLIVSFISTPKVIMSFGNLILRPLYTSTVFVCLHSSTSMYLLRVLIVSRPKWTFLCCYPLAMPDFCIQKSYPSSYNNEKAFIPSPVLTNSSNWLIVSVSLSNSFLTCSFNFPSLSLSLLTNTS